MGSGLLELPAPMPPRSIKPTPTRGSEPWPRELAAQQCSSSVSHQNRFQLGVELSQLLAQLSLPVMAVVLLRASWPVDDRISQSQMLEGGWSLRSTVITIQSLLLLRDFLSTLSRSPRSAIERRADREGIAGLHLCLRRRQGHLSR